MLLKNRNFQKVEPSRDAKLFIIYCEGKKREPQYFNYFNEISSQIKLEIIPAPKHGDNSPTGLFNRAKKDIIKDKENLDPKYEINDDDEIWFVIDTDKWGKKITELRTLCRNQPRWFIAQSNPCFEVWLYYHQEKEAPQFPGMDKAGNWKKYLNEIISGGFQSKKHAIHINEAIINAENNFHNKDGIIQISSTEVFKLAKNFYPLVQKSLEEFRRQFEE